MTKTKVDRDSGTFWTPEKCCNAVHDMVMERIPDAEDRIWIDPAAGGGNLLVPIVGTGIEMFASTLDEDDAVACNARGIPCKKLDFINGDISQIEQLFESGSKIHVHMNPPYGRPNAGVMGTNNISITGKIHDEMKALKISSNYNIMDQFLYRICRLSEGKDVTIMIITGINWLVGERGKGFRRYWLDRFEFIDGFLGPISDYTASSNRSIMHSVWRSGRTEDPRSVVCEARRDVAIPTDVRHVIAPPDKFLSRWAKRQGPVGPVLEAPMKIKPGQTFEDGTSFGSSVFFEHHSNNQEHSRFDMIESSRTINGKGSSVFFDMVGNDQGHTSIDHLNSSRMVNGNGSSVFFEQRGNEPNNTHLDQIDSSPTKELHGSSVFFSGCANDHDDVHLDNINSSRTINSNGSIVYLTTDSNDPDHTHFDHINSSRTIHGQGSSVYLTTHSNDQDHCSFDNINSSRTIDGQGSSFTGSNFEQLFYTFAVRHCSPSAWMTANFQFSAPREPIPDQRLADSVVYIASTNRNNCASFRDAGWDIPNEMCWHPGPHGEMRMMATWLVENMHRLSEDSIELIEATDDLKCAAWRIASPEDVLSLQLNRWDFGLYQIRRIKGIKATEEFIRFDSILKAMKARLSVEFWDDGVYDMFREV